LLFFIIPLLGLDILNIAKLFFPPAISGVLCPKKTKSSIKNITLSWAERLKIHKNKFTVRQYSSLNNGDDKFYEWFCGITDAEGCFRIERISGQTFQFIFKILLHIDDINMLYYIKDRLGIGSVKIYGNTANFTVTSQKDLGKILSIFADYPLKSTKLLNFLEFKRAFELYLSSKNKTKDLSLEIEKIKSTMNRGRLNFQLPEGHRPIVTSYWLLGFVEGEGSFHLDRSSNRLIFNITLSGNDLALLEGIKDFLYNLSEVESSSNLSKASIMIYVSKSSTRAAHLSIKNTDFIKSVIIPFFSSMVWQSKKFLDFQDWVLVFKLREQGHHYTDKGLRLIELILSQMNNNRLSTSKLVRVDRALLHADIDRMLSGPSNYEIKEDRIYIKSLNKYLSSPKAKVVQLVDNHSGETLQTFTSLTACAKSLGMAQSTVWVKYTKAESFLFNGKLVKIKREVPSTN
jgi:hypothetical protein